MHNNCVSSVFSSSSTLLVHPGRDNCRSQPVMCSSSWPLSHTPVWCTCVNLLPLAPLDQSFRHSSGCGPTSESSFLYLLCPKGVFPSLARWWYSMYWQRILYQKCISGKFDIELDCWHLLAKLSRCQQLLVYEKGAV